ncbi:NAD(P)/FAD-dependent oxidoreductase [Paenibacillus aceris]|uniref:NADH dehydrogenase n=1 Tax=Paenibacillus aceris TaxID=869555 RepID=A0ABS4HV73_9BACL|nr:FAD-dependent oxidoreductase [Paenibacillus aceris]MBP1962536.1 NADH dehydrogenase [Paenibacillus aceris]NHW37346.1 FAD-dependent oxidoreductase [Paenibacillus aceris]
MKKFVILGGGYGGLTIALNMLEKDLPEDTILEMVDRSPFQGLKTEYYALASGTIAETHIRVAYPDDPRLLLTYGEVSAVDLEKKEIRFEDREPLTYDWLVIGLGCVDSYHGIIGAMEHSSSIQTLAQTRATYQRINNIAPYGQVSIIGGGLSGVEMASELRESRPDLNIRLIDRGPSLLSAFPSNLQQYVREWMIEHHIELRPNVSLCRLDGGDLYNGDEIIRTDATIWTAGIQPNPIVEALNVPKDRQGRIMLNEYHQIPEHQDVFVVGDCASLPFSPSAQAAQAQGKQIAEAMQAIWKGETPRLGKIKLRGTLGSLGKKSGFGIMGKRTLMTGKIARMLKSGVLWKSKRHFG